MSIGVRIALVALAAVALRRELSDLNLSQLAAQLQGFGLRHAVLGVAGTVGSFVLLGGIELLALRTVALDRGVPARTGLMTGFVSHALSQSVGVALLTGAAVRLRAYRRYAFDAGDVARTTAFVTLTVTLGLLATGAVAFLASSAPLRVWHAALPVRAMGVVLAALVAAYVAWSASAARAFVGRGAWRIARPSTRLALAQVALSGVDWILTGSLLYLLLPRALGVDYATMLRVYLVAQTVGTLSHVPGGAGVFELLVLTLLAPVTSPAQLSAVVAALVMFRVLYYLLPLIAACAVAGIAELRASRRTLRRRRMLHVA